jgi:hypothetical protein
MQGRGKSTMAFCTKRRAEGIDIGGRRSVILHTVCVQRIEVLHELVSHEAVYLLPVEWLLTLALHKHGPGVKDLFDVAGALAPSVERATTNRGLETCVETQK